MSHERAIESCKKLPNIPPNTFANLISLANSVEPLVLENLAALSVNSDLKDAVYLTSAVREGSNWIWAGDRVALEKDPILPENGSEIGRCAGLRFSKEREQLDLVAADCNANAHLPLCELNLAVNCVPSNGRYQGQVDKTTTGLPCMNWDDPSIVRSGLFTPQQKFWRHNFCRNLNGSTGGRPSRPWCMVSPTQFQECDVTFCDFKPNDIVDKPEDFKPCGKDEIRCGLSNQCIHSGFWCDYEIDCRNGQDEIDCVDYLHHFDLVGQYKFTEAIHEVWINIPHIQKCAEKCFTRQTSASRCESFSYEPVKELCLLSQTTQNPAMLVPNPQSVFYRRKLVSNHSLRNISLEPGTNAVIATKNGIDAGVCVDEYESSDKSLDAICGEFGFGPSMSLRKEPPSQTNSKERLTPNQIIPINAVNRHYWPLLVPIIPVLTLAESRFHQTGLGTFQATTQKFQQFWTPDCLQSNLCSHPQISTQQLDLSRNVNCSRFLHCSQCDPSKHFACQSSGECIKLTGLCNGKVDCQDGTDERECKSKDMKLRFTNKIILGKNKSVEGKVQVQFYGGYWDVCVDDFITDGGSWSPLNAICENFEHRKLLGRALPVLPPTSTSPIWHIKCRQSSVTLNSSSSTQCVLEKLALCQNGILQLRCDPISAAGSMPIKSRQRRIVGGKNSRPGESPWTAALRLRSEDVHHCGAAIIAKRFLLTAAHCFRAKKNPKDYFITTGDWDNAIDEEVEQRFDLAAIHYYPTYTEDLFQHDIAILEVSDSIGIRFDHASHPICLPPRGYAYTTGQVCTVTGWGSSTPGGGDESTDNYPTKLQTAQMPILDKSLCRNVSNTYESISENSFCAGYLKDGGMDSCQGDSGGPFACEHNGHFYLAGIISWGEGCAQRGHPGIYTMITPYLSWIENVTNIVF
ncbi:trypsin domain-containing protein [Ditylenchus destructor]|nr:trypsin domain-containing protein [Ditylenchus destructor]